MLSFGVTFMADPPVSQAASRATAGTGVSEVVLQRGNLLVRGGTFHGTPAAGRFLQRSRFGPGQHATAGIA